MCAVIFFKQKQWQTKTKNEKLGVFGLKRWFMKIWKRTCVRILEDKWLSVRKLFELRNVRVNLKRWFIMIYWNLWMIWWLSEFRNLEI